MSERFEPGWLELREPVDHRSRAEELVAPLRAWWSARGAASVVDLGAGTGSNLRWLAPRLPEGQIWTLIDHDSDLLARVRAPAGIDARTVAGDLSDEGIARARSADLVTASALLDLVSRAWLEALVAACAEARAGALFALTYDGAVTWPGKADPLDDVVSDALNAHQRRDKGTGPALGPTASVAAEELFAARGYRTRLAASPWVLGPDAARLARTLLDGWASAAAEQVPERADEIAAWARRRAEGASRPDFGLVVGHVDLLALPEDARW